MIRGQREDRETLEVVPAVDERRGQSRGQEEDVRKKKKEHTGRTHTYFYTASSCDKSPGGEKG